MTNITASSHRKSRSFLQTCLLAFIAIIGSVSESHSERSAPSTRRQSLASSRGATNQPNSSRQEFTSMSITASTMPPSPRSPIPVLLGLFGFGLTTLPSVVHQRRPHSAGIHRRRRAPRLCLRRPRPARCRHHGIPSRQYLRRRRLHLLLHVLVVVLATSLDPRRRLAQSPRTPAAWPPRSSSGASSPSSSGSSPSASTRSSGASSFCSPSPSSCLAAKDFGFGAFYGKLGGYLGLAHRHRCRPARVSSSCLNAVAGYTVVPLGQPFVINPALNGRVGVAVV